ncbi:MAG: thioredoxin domain-containing protein [Acidobacteria bacterium]|nr:thioredoxin domain-containing protein [Acidobacteriota bacterium]
MFDRRERRVRPGLDDKVLTEWNALFLSALAEAGAALGNEAWLTTARQIADFLLAQLRVDGRWRRSWQAETGPRHLAYAADHAALVDAFTRLAEATGEARWIAEARTAADAMLELFWDGDGGGLFTTGHDAEQLVARQKDLLDGATPSANSLAAVALARLAAITGESRYDEAATTIVTMLGEVASSHPSAFANLLAAVDLVTGGITEVAVAGDRADLVAAVHHRYLPSVVLTWGERFDSPLWDGRTDGHAYVCEHFTCNAPVDAVDALLEQLHH